MFEKYLCTLGLAPNSAAAAAASIIVINIISEMASVSIQSKKHNK